MENINSYNKTTSLIFKGVLLYTLCGIINGIVGPISSLSSAASFLTGNGPGALGIFSTILSVAIILGYVLFVYGINKLKGLVYQPDQKAVKRILVFVTLQIIAMFFGIFHLGIVKSIISVVAIIFGLLGYKGMKQSMTLPISAKKGASNLYVAMILSIIGTLLGLIPLAGAVLNGILGTIAFILEILGWKKIATPVIVTN